MEERESDRRKSGDRHNEVRAFGDMALFHCYFGSS